MVGNLDRLFHREVVLAQKVEHAAAAREFAGRLRMVDDVVVLFRLTRVGWCTGDDRHDPGDLPQLAQMLVVHIQVAEDDDIIFRTAVVTNDAVDVVRPDLRLAGGPTSLLEVGTMADAFRRPYASHGGGPVQLNVMACLPNALYLETGLIGPDSPLQLVDGCALVPSGAGFGWG